MDTQMWHQRWEDNRIAFHLTEVNAHLQQFWSTLAPALAGRVLVPLCGKSLDMLWLAGEGHEVLGVEISPIAVQDFFRDNELKVGRREHRAFEIWRHGGVELWLGDFFDLGPDDVSDVSSVYDRASLIALPPTERMRYAEHMMRLAPRHAPILLVTLEYDPMEMSGPPFPVTESEVDTLYGQVYHVECLHRHDALADSAHFRSQGVTKLMEKVYRLTPR